jgi:hypothetical protein
MFVDCVMIASVTTKSSGVHVIRTGCTLSLDEPLWLAKVLVYVSGCISIFNVIN